MNSSIYNIKRKCFPLILVALSVYVEQCLALKAVNTSDCFWTSTVNGNPSCSFQMSTDANSVSIQCLKPGVLQVSGDFKVFYINCTAIYPLDFKFDGHKPTEAIHANAWGQVEKNSKGKFKLFHLDIKVFSISSLYDYYSNLFPNNRFTHKDSYNYSQTGNYIISGYHEREGFESKFYIFFEESWAKKTFIRNENVTFVVPTSTTTEAFGESKLTVPCRPSFFHDIVILDQTGNKKEIDFAFDASIGFTSIHSWSTIVEDEPLFWLNLKLTFTCLLGRNEKPDDFIEFPAKDPDTPYGFGDLPKLKNTYEVSRLYNVEILANGSISTKRTCTFDIKGAVDDEDRGILIYLGVDNPIMYRLQYHFVLPIFSTRSYLADKLNVTLLNGSIDLALLKGKGTTSLVENSFCMVKNKYLVSTVTIGVSGRHEIIIYGSDFARGKVEYETSFHFKISRDPPSSAEMYVNQKITFRCYIHAFYYIRPAIWYTERTNGTVFEEIIDYNWNNSFFSYATIKLTKDVRKVVCAAAIWHSSEWRNISMNIDLQDSQEPTFEDGPTAVINLPLDSVNQNLKCTATGIPQPLVYWQRNEKNISSSSISINTISSSEYSWILEFPSVKQEDEGEYICIASNVANTRKKVFTVSVFTENGYGLWTSIGIPVAVLICGVVATSAWVYVKHYRLEKTGLTKKEIENFINGECVPEACELKHINCNRNANEYAHENTHLSPYNNAYEIAQNRYEIDTTKVLGSGAYGMVLLGSLDGGPVAIKTVKRNADKTYLKALLSELKVMTFLGDHENIVGILGASTVNLKSGELFIFVPYCGLGNLENYLRSNRQLYISDQDGYINTRGNTTDTADEYVNERSVDYITLNNLYEWSIQIAEGMKYLGTKKVIHGDLAARNILLSNDRIAKITDFGLSRQLYNYSEYAKKQQAPLPWRYMALESLRDLRFSTKSDVWSYGILLWEIFSLAQTPYAGYSWTMGFVNELENGLCLMRPPLSSDNLYNNIMKKCWHSDPQSRPSFGQIQEHLTTHNIS